MDRLLCKAIDADTGEWRIGFYRSQHLKIVKWSGRQVWERVHNIVTYGESAEEEFRYPINPDTICQSTGLKDKNGKLIFEGDEILCPKEEWCKRDYSIAALFGKPVPECEDFKEYVEYDFDMLSMRKNDYPEYWELTGNNIHDKEN